MSRVQIILTPGGERLAIMPAEEYEALVGQTINAEEDATDLARIDELLAAKERGATLSLEGTKRILAGESPVRVWREERGYTQKELAVKAGIGANHVSMIELGHRVGTTATLKRLAKALQVDIDDLVA
jgi:DNA-binding XRE family transcriptional regulator